MSADALLKARALDIFKDEKGAADVYRGLAKRWHPDGNNDPKANAVFAHLTAIFQDAKRAWINGTYPNTLTIQKKDGPHHYPYLASVPFELGELYICERHVIWAARRSEDDLSKRWLETVKVFAFPSPEIEASLRPHLPRNSHTIANGDRAYTIVDRPADYVRLADVIAKKGPFDPRHVAWAMSRAYNIACALEYMNVQHADISPETFFIEPATHFGALLGGWYYSAPPKSKLLAAPARNAHLVKSEGLLDAQIRLMGRRMLGVTSPGQLHKILKDTEPLKSWLLGTPKKSVIQANADWYKTLEAAFGKRRFTKLELTTAEVYG